MVNISKIFSNISSVIPVKTIGKAVNRSSTSGVKLTPLATDVIELSKPINKVLSSVLKQEDDTLRLVFNNKDLGVMQLVKKGMQYAKKGYPEDYKTIQNGIELLKPAQEINILYSYEKGAGTKLVQEAVKKSFENGFDGRVLLNACCIDKKTSPLAFYYKLGFRSIDSKTNELIEKCIRKGKIIPKDLGSFMFLPKENIQKLLSK